MNETKTLRKVVRKTAQAMLGLLAITLGTQAHAVLVTVGGVTWDPDAAGDFTARSDNITQQFTPLATPGFVALSGWGLITNVNSTGPATFCVGCELTFTFSGYTQVAAVVANPSFGEFIGGTVRVFRDDTPDFVGNGSEAQASDGDLWLSLIGHQEAAILAGATFRTLFANAGTSGATGTGLLDVNFADMNGGLASAWFDTNARSGGADFDFQNSFTAGSGFTLGSGNFSAESSAPVPVPGTLVILAAGLLGLRVTRALRANPTA